MLFTDKDMEHHRVQGTCSESIRELRSQAVDPALTLNTEIAKRVTASPEM